MMLMIGTIKSVKPGLRTVVASLALAGSGVLSLEGGEVPATGINDAARLLAGMAGEKTGLAGELANTRAWKSHAEAMEHQWSRYERGTLKPMAEWSGNEIGSRVRDGAVVRYMFSGPDILHAVRVFPQGGTFILAGLEPVGEAPEVGKLSADSIDRPLAEVRKALEEIIQFSFFKTIDMKVDLSQATFRGTLPVMCLFLARSGIEIESIEFLTLGEDGALASLGGESADADAVRLVTARDAAMRRKTIYYFQTDISDGKVGKSGFLKFLESKEAGVSYVKAASYLMHNDSFSAIRGHLLAYSEIVVEDDSGIPLRFFKPGEWEVALYGSYTSPIPLFQEHYQADLRKAYQGGQPKALDFGTGYRWRKSDSNLLVAARLPGGPVAQTVEIAETAPPAPEVAAAVTLPPAGAPAAGTAEPPPVPSDPGSPGVEVAVAPEAPVETKPVSDHPVEITLRLLRKSDLSDLDRLTSNTLAVFEYEVVSVERGDYPYATMRLADGIVWGGRVSVLARREPGAIISLEVVPLRQYPNLERIRRIDTLDPAEGLPVFVPRL